MPDPVAPPEIRLRAGELTALGREQAEAEHALLVGREVEVLFESRRHGAWSGLTDTYVRALVESDRDLHNVLAPVRVVRSAPDGVVGTLA
jgi:tRNA A37 methylthiotransferase MiaB